MYRAPDGKCLVSCDFGQEELCVLAYTLKQRYGKSVMYNLINRGLDLHGTFSLYRDGKLSDFDLHNLSDDDVATIRNLCKPYKEVSELKKSRQLSKAANFGHENLLVV